MGWSIYLYLCLCLRPLSTSGPIVFEVTCCTIFSGVNLCISHVCDMACQVI